VLVVAGTAVDDESPAAVAPVAVVEALWLVPRPLPLLLLFPLLVWLAAFPVLVRSPLKPEELAENPVFDVEFAYWLLESPA